VLTEIQNPKFIPTTKDIEECDKVKEYFGLNRVYVNDDGSTIGMNFIKDFIPETRHDWDKNYQILIYIISMSEFQDLKKLKKYKEELKRIRSLPFFKNSIIVNVYTQKEKFQTMTKEDSINIEIEDKFKRLFLDDYSLNFVEEYPHSMGVENILELVKKIFTNLHQNIYEFPKPKEFKVIILGLDDTGKSTIHSRTLLNLNMKSFTNVYESFMSKNIIAVNQSMNILNYHKDEDFLNQFPILDEIKKHDYGRSFHSAFCQKDKLLINHLLKDPKFIDIVENNLYKLPDCHRYLFQNYNEIYEKIENDKLSEYEILRFDHIIHEKIPWWKNLGGSRFQNKLQRKSNIIH
jgi:hypothetical protein